MSNGTVIRSVSDDQSVIIEDIITLHCPDGFDCDMTFGNGVFWKGKTPPRLRFDIDPQVDGVIEADSQSLPIAPESVGNIIFDPPFLTYIRSDRKHKDGAMLMSKRFGGYWTYDELIEHYRGTISEAWRVMKYGSKFVVKCQDIIHNHKMHATHIRTALMAELEGFRLVDQFVLTARHRLPSPQSGKQRHARIFHSYFLVFSKDRTRARLRQFTDFGGFE